MARRPRASGVRAVTLAFCALGLGVLAAQVPVRDGVRPAATGTGSIAGRVTIAGEREGGPLRRARVTLEGAGPALEFIETDTDGRYRFDRLPSGSFRVKVEKPGFVTLEFGAKRAFVQPPPISIAANQSFAADLALPRGAALEGRLTNSKGTPVQNATVSAVRLMYGPNGRRPVPVGQATTDDRGQFRIHSLPPGDYYVQTVGDRLFYDRQSAALRRVDHALTYYPGASRVGEAKSIRVGIGEEAANLDFTLATVPVARISIEVTDSRGQPPASSLAALQPVGNIYDTAKRRYSPSQRGIFEFPATLPGEYWLVASAVPEPGAPTEFAAMRVTVSSEDAELHIRTERGAALEGRVEADGGSALAGALRLVVHEIGYASPAASGTVPSGPSVDIAADGRFTIPSLLGPKLFRVTGLPDGWAVRGVWLDGIDITDAATDLGSTAKPRGLRIVVTSRTATVSGGVTDNRQRSVAEARVLLFSDDEARWNGPSSRFVKSALAGADGHFVIRGLLPGKYRVAAFDYLEDNAWTDPYVLRSLKERSDAIEIAEGDNRTLTLTSRGEP